MPARLLLFATLAAVVFIRLRLSSMPLERDEGEYAYFGQLMLDGVPPYQAAYNMKWPGTYASYAAIMAVFGQTTVAIRLGLILINLLTVFFVYQIAKRCTNASGGCIAAGVYAILSISPSVLGLAAHATHFVLLPGLMAVWLVQPPDEHRNLGRLFLAGAAAGAATIMRQSGAAFFGFLVFWVALSAHREKLGCRTMTIRLASVAAGFGIPIGIMLISVAGAGTFGRFWFWTWVYAKAYAGIPTIPTGAGNLAAQLSRMITAAPVLWTGVFLGALALLLGRRNAKDRAFAGVFVVCSFLGVCPGLNFSPYYMVQFLPAAALLVAIGASAGRQLAGDSARLSRLAGVFGLFVALGSAQALYVRRDVFFLQTPQVVSRTIYGFNPFIEAVEIGRYLAVHCPKNARIAVLGSEPEIYFYAGRRGVTGYLYIYPMTESQPYARPMQREFMAEIEEGAPEYVVFVSVICSWFSSSRFGTEASLLGWFQGYERENLTLVGFAELGDGGAKYRWAFDESKVVPPLTAWIAVYRRMLSSERAAAATDAKTGTDRPKRTTIAW